MSSRDDLGSLEPNLEDLDRYEPLDDLDRATAERPRRGPVLSILVFILVAGAAAAGTWYVLELGGEDESIPLVTADPEPVKVRPDKPGGLEVPHQEISVLNQPAREAERPEVLLPPPEAPMPVPPPPLIETPGAGVPAVPTVPVEAAEPLAAIRKPEPITEIVIPPLPPLPPGGVPNQPDGASSGGSTTGETEARLAAPPLPKIPAPPAAPPAPVAQTPPPPSPPMPEAAVAPPPPAPMPQPKIEATPAPPPGPPAAPVANGYRAQVASAKGQADANRKVAQLRKAHADLFGPLPLRVRRVDLGAKGIWYRVQAGAFAEMGQATALCEELKRRGEKGCWVAR